MKELKLELIESNTTRERTRFRKGLHYHPRLGVFLSRTGKIHICEYQIKYPLETKETFGVVSYMETLNLTRCQIIAPFRIWLSSKNTEGLNEDGMSQLVVDQLCSSCGDIGDFLKALSG